MLSFLKITYDINIWPITGNPPVFSWSSYKLLSSLQELFFEHNLALSQPNMEAGESVREPSLCARLRAQRFPCIEPGHPPRTSGRALESPPH